ncbi:MAG: hypothetical protein JXR76_22705 [Deltaproteobacteria bacterium]|nr:hypothetical protein [Deltaproteobacteria bacterium]
MLKSWLAWNWTACPNAPALWTEAQLASFVSLAGVGAMDSIENQAFVDGAYIAVATQELTAGTICYEKCTASLSLLMLNGDLAPPPNLAIAPAQLQRQRCIQEGYREHSFSALRDFIMATQIVDLPLASPAWVW